MTGGLSQEIENALRRAERFKMDNDGSRIHPSQQSMPDKMSSQKAINTTGSREGQAQTNWDGYSRIQKDQINLRDG